ncbi:MAG: MFS transporter, partial [Comamonas sp.]
GPALVTRLGAGLVTLSFAAMALAGFIPAGAQLGLLVAAAIGFDLGIQAALIAHQSIIYGLDPAARSRLNAVLFTGMFIGMAVGSAVAAQLFAHFGWMAVTALAPGTALAATAGPAAESTT